MVTAPAVILFGTAVSIGLYMGFQYLAGARNRPMVIALHLLFGAAGLEVTAMILRGAPDGTAGASDWLGPASALTLAAALVTGLLVPIIAKPAPRAIAPALAVHASVAMVGFLGFLYWVLQL